MLEPRGIHSIGDAIKYCIDALNHGLQTLPQEDRLKEAIEISTINGWQIDHVLGQFGVAFERQQFSENKVPGQIVQDEDVGIKIVVVVNWLQNKPKPYEFVELVKDSIGGLEIENNKRPENKVWLSDVQFLDERKIGQWWYGVTAYFPGLFAEKSIRKKYLGV